MDETEDINCTQNMTIDIFLKSPIAMKKHKNNENFSLKEHRIGIC